MKYPGSEMLAIVTASDGSEYVLDFYGENEGAAVICGPRPPDVSQWAQVPEVHREPAKDAGDARAKLRAWCAAKGWK